jgi:hypothetical protein
MAMVKRASWLSITPEPERELPWAVATLAEGRPAAPHAVERERARIERLLLRGSQRRWLSYLRGVIGLIESPGSARAARDPELARARALAAAVISNHHALLLGLPGGAARRTAADRAALAAAMASITRQERDLHEHDRVAANGRI